MDEEQASRLYEENEPLAHKIANSFLSRNTGGTLDREEVLQQCRTYLWQTILKIKPEFTREQIRVYLWQGVYGWMLWWLKKENQQESFLDRSVLAEDVGRLDEGCLGVELDMMDILSGSIPRNHLFYIMKGIGEEPTEIVLPKGKELKQLEEKLKQWMRE